MNNLRNMIHEYLKTVGLICPKAKYFQSAHPYIYILNFMTKALPRSIGNRN